ncbi:hypothetical protein HA466_0124580 [Hirschfeldia incana]|nr:hypothetical protein HA466_0124580 [Hirschfeldia incana]
MRKNVSKATPEYATSETLVWWDMDNCPLPNGYDPSRLGPRIDTELKNLGYNGPLTLVAVGNLDGIPSEFLNVLASDGFVIKHSGEGMDESMIDYFDSRDRLRQPPPVTIMVISGDPRLLETVTLEIYVRPDYGYNLLLAYPPYSEPEQPHPSSFVPCFGGEWLWDRVSLLKGSSDDEETRRLDKGKGSKMSFSCELCDFFCPSYEDFTSHLQKSMEHADMVEELNDDRDFKFKLSLQELDEDKLSSSYRAKVRKTKSYFKSIHEHCTSKIKFKKQPKATQEVVSSLSKNSSSSKAKKKKASFSYFHTNN